MESCQQEDEAAKEACVHCYDQAAPVLFERELPYVPVCVWDLVVSMLYSRFIQMDVDIHYAKDDRYYHHYR